MSFRKRYIRCCSYFYSHIITSFTLKIKVSNKKSTHLRTTTSKTSVIRDDQNLQFLVFFWLIDTNPVLSLVENDDTFIFFRVIVDFLHKNTFLRRKLLTTLLSWKSRINKSECSTRFFWKMIGQEQVSIWEGMCWLVADDLYLFLSWWGLLSTLKLWKAETSTEKAKGRSEWSFLPPWIGLVVFYAKILWV